MEFYSDGGVRKAECTAAPSVTPAPTTEHRQLKKLECLSADCNATVAFPIDETVSYAFLNMTILGNHQPREDHLLADGKGTSAHVDVDGTSVTCGKEFCEEDGCLSNFDVTDIARQKGVVNVTVLVGPLVEPRCFGYEGKKFAFQAFVEIFYVVSGTTVPTRAPSMSLAPTTYETPRDIFRLVECQEKNCTITFDEQDFIWTSFSSAELRLTLQGAFASQPRAYADVTINGKDHTRCGDAYCKETECLTRKVNGPVSIAISTDVGRDCGSGHIFRAVARLRVVPSFTIGTPVPTAHPDETFQRFEADLLNEGFANLSGTVIPFQRSIDLSGPYTVRNGTLDGNGRTRFFTLVQANLTLENVTMTNGFAFDGGAIDATKSVILIRNSSVSQCKSIYGGVLYLVESSAVAIETTFEHNYADNSHRTTLGQGGVVYMSRSTFRVAQCTFRSNAARHDGGVALLDDSTFDADDSDFQLNLAVHYYGGVVYAIHGSTVHLTSSTLKKNEAGNHGGAVAANRSTVHILGSFFRGNFAGGDGGVVGLRNSSKLTVSGSTFRANTGFYGGVVSSWLSTAVVTDSIFSKNQAHALEGKGGVVYVYSSSSVIATNVTFEGNNATVNGGVVYVDDALFQASNAVFTTNTAGTFGHVAYVTQSGAFKIRNSSFLDNKNNVYLTRAGTAELYNTSFNGSLTCKVSGTTDAALLQVDLTHTRFILDPNCVLFLYQANSDGSPAFKTTLEDTVLNSSSTTSLIDHVYWTTPCGAGQFSADGIDHGDGDDTKDIHGVTIDENDPSCDNNDVPCLDRCETCPPGKYLPFTLNRFAHVGEISCFSCPVGTSLDDEGHWWLHDSVDDCVPCDPGTFSNEPGSQRCSNCSKGEYQDESGQTFCRAAPPGTFVAKDKATMSTPCHAGTYSLGGHECTSCTIGRYQPKQGQTQCLIADPGWVVDHKAAVTQSPCEAGTSSRGGTGTCEPCEIGTFQPNAGQPSCIACPSPLTTTKRGRTYCDACLPDYFWNSDVYKKILHNDRQCVDCCQRCEESCTIDKKCIHCDRNGSTLLALDLKRGFWRPTNRSTTVEPCVPQNACPGGKEVASCKPGHTGALCGACADNYATDPRGHCVRCRPQILIKVAGNLALILLLVVALIMFAPCHHGRSLSMRLIDHWMDEMNLRRRGEAKEEEPAEDYKEAIDETKDERSVRREKLRKSLVTKIKILIAALQIAASADSILFQVQFPALFTIVTYISGLLGFAIFDVGSFKCLFHWTYFDELLAVTLTPFAVVPLGAGIYLLMQRWRGYDPAKARPRILYTTLLFLFIVLPSISTKVITYFSCQKFDTGDGEKNLFVIAMQPDIPCTSPRYRYWKYYTAVMIAVWPVGMTMGLALLLWAHRRKLNPDVEKKFTRKERQLHDIEKLRHRDADPSISGLAFLFEEYECRCYWFPVFEIVRRLFLSSALAVFYPGKVHQVLVGLLGAMASYVAYSYTEPFIDHDDNVVAAVAQGELVLIYFSALAVYASDLDDENGFSGKAFGAVLIIVYFTSFLVAAYIIILDLFGYSTLVDVFDDSSVFSSFSFRSRRRRASSSSSSSGGGVDSSSVTTPPYEPPSSVATIDVARPREIELV